jgi:hypothetical protein
MQIKLSDKSYPLAKPVPVEITYENPTGSVLVIDNPVKSLAVEMHLLDLRTKEDLSYTMGKIITTSFGGDRDAYALVTPIPEPLQIAPGASFVFSSDPNERIYLRTGKFDCFLTDASGESNHIELTIEFTRESVDGLFEMAKDEEQEYSRREWAMDWLQKLHHEFRLKLPLPGEPTAKKAQDEADNKVVYAEFAAWWNQNKRAADMDGTLKCVR